MRDDYIIAAGGTGAMCAQAFIYMAAAGCADNGNKYHILLIDKDKESDAMTSCQNLLSNYTALRDQQVQKAGKYEFPEIVLNTWDFTSELVDEYQKRTGLPAAALNTMTLEQLLNPHKNPQMGRVLSTMYTKAEREANLDQGFYGHPNIGAPVFDYVRDRFLAASVVKANETTVTNAFMTSLRNTLSKGNAHVYLFGSLFGGTGATIIPNVVLALRTLTDSAGAPVGQQRLILGGSVIMPYFKLPTCPNDSVEKLSKVIPEDQKFAEQTKDALMYYHESNLLGNLMNLLLVGASSLDVTSEIFARGGCQTQHFHGVLLVAAAAANRFFADELGNMAKGLGGPEVVPQQQLLVWKVNPDMGGSYHTLTKKELDLGNEYDKLEAFLRFSIIVKYYMGWKFSKNAVSLMHENEVRGTAKSMGLDPKQITPTEITDYYKVPVQNASAICEGFIKFYRDVALSGYDWSQYKDLVKSAAPVKTEKGKSYYAYTLGGKAKSAAAGFDNRWTDLANVTSLEGILDAGTLASVVQGKSLNSVLTFNMLDPGRAPNVETHFPNSVTNVYLKTLKDLGLVSGLLGGVKRDDVYFCEIYDKLRENCK